jgi:hypothetical protein
MVAGTGTILALTAISAAVSAAGAVAQSRQQAAAQKFQEAVARQQAERQRAQTAYDVDVARRKSSRTLAALRARTAGSGISGFGTPLLVQRDLAGQAELNALNILSQGNARAASLGYGADLASMRADQAITGGLFKAGESLLSGALRAAKVPAAGSSDLGNDQSTSDLGGYGSFDTGRGFNSGSAGPHLILL